MTEHLRRVEGICKELGLSPMMWGDMLFRVNIRGNGYYDETVVLPERMADVIPKEYQVVYWDYYHNTQLFYAAISTSIRSWASSDIAGGVCSWLGMQPNLIKSKASVQAGLAACRDAGIHEVSPPCGGTTGGKACQARYSPAYRCLRRAPGRSVRIGATGLPTCRRGSPPE
jgi:hypothetical protein